METWGGVSGPQEQFQHTNICSAHQAAGLGLHCMSGVANIHSQGCQNHSGTTCQCQLLLQYSALLSRLHHRPPS